MTLTPQEILGQIQAERAASAERLRFLQNAHVEAVTAAFLDAVRATRWQYGPDGLSAENPTFSHLVGTARHAAGLHFFSKGKHEVKFYVVNPTEEEPPTLARLIRLGCEVVVGDEYIRTHEDAWKALEKARKNMAEAQDKIDRTKAWVAHNPDPEAP